MGNKSKKGSIMGNDGGPAFPHTVYTDSGNSNFGGMSLRAYLTAAALTGLASRGAELGDAAKANRVPVDQFIATVAVQLADATIGALEAEPEAKQ